MSVVTNAIIACSISHQQDRLLKEINAYFKQPQSPGFVHTSEVQDAFGGSKQLECEIFMGAFNYLDREKLIAHLKNLNFDLIDVGWMQLILCEQDDDKFFIYEIIER